MSRPNTAYVEPRERDDDVVVTEPAPPPFLPSGAAVLVARIYACGVEAKSAADALATAIGRRDMRAVIDAVEAFAKAVQCDPKMLAKRLSADLAEGRAP